MNKIYPFPEILDSKHWDIADVGPMGQPRTSPGQGLLWVPTDDTPKDRFIRNHELAHIKWSPHESPIEAAKKLGLEVIEETMECLQSLEDARIQIKMQEIGLDVIGAGDCDQRLVDRIKKLDFAQLTELIICTHPTETEDFILGHIHSSELPFEKLAEAREVATTAIRKLNRCDSFSDTVEACKWLQEKLKGKREQEKLAKQMARGEAEQASVMGALIAISKAAAEGEKGDPIEVPTFGKNVSLGEIVAQAAEDGVEVLTRRRRSFNSDKGRWGKMTLDMAPCSEPITGRMLGRNNAAAQEGTQLTYPGRWATDKAIFRTKLKRKGGSVLIDCSGSMSLTSDEITSILDAAPAAISALYAGSHNGTGVVRIVTKNGRRAPQRYIHQPSGHLNIIDGPALDWLGKQQEPRIWVSDGQVTGETENRSPKLDEDCASKCRKHRIVRRGTVREAIAFLKALNRR